VSQTTAAWTTEQPAPAPATGARHDFQSGLLVSLILFAVFAGVGLSVDVPRTALGFKSDEATYYLMAHSLARDGDLAYRKQDIARVWHEFPSGPLGVFLKRGRTVDVDAAEQFPFVRLTTGPDPDARRLFYGKSYIYPVFASPFVWLAGTNGFLFFHALLLGVAIFAAYLFLNTRCSPTVSALIATAYFLAAVPAGYFVWMTPELFNLVVVTLGFFCWLYKEVAPPDLPRGLRWLRTPRSNTIAVLLLAIATFSKPSNALLIAPIVLLFAMRRQWWRAIGAGLGFAIVVALLFAINVAVTGEWNFQGGERSTYYRDFPFLEEYSFTPAPRHTTNRLLTEVIFDPRVFWTNLGHNLVYFFAGRHSGLVAYFFPCLFALVCFLWPRTRRQSWQWLLLAAACAEILLLLIWIPYNYFGGAGVLGNRYFMNTYGLFLFLVPPLRSIGAALVPWMVGALFTAPITLNPFYASFRPYEVMKHGPLRWLPIELTLVNDLPINAHVTRVRVLFGTAPRFQIYFLDDNAYEREHDAFWIRGNSRADMLFKTPEPVRRLRLTLASGAHDPRVSITVADEGVTLQMTRGEVRNVEIPLGEGFPYQGTRVWPVSVRVHGGFVPMFDGDTNDHRYLGVLVSPQLLP
jgi:hypothetical protein